MSSSGQHFKGLLDPTRQRVPPISARTEGLNFVIQYIRDSLHLTTWLCLGGLAFGVLFLAFGYLAFIPAASWVGLRAADSLLISTGFKRNTYLDGIIPQKTTTAFPDEAGNYGSRPANSELYVFILGTRCNHPLRALTPGMAEIRSFMPRLVSNMEAHRDEYGYLGMTTWLNANQRQATSELMNICYFHNVEGLHKFAHSTAHRDSWNWWNKHTKTMPHLSIWHETYQVPKGSWETIYINSHITGLNATSMKYTDEMSGEEMYKYPIVDASRGRLRTSAGRMSRSSGTEHDSYGDDPYQT